MQTQILYLYFYFYFMVDLLGQSLSLTLVFYVRYGETLSWLSSWYHFLSIAGTNLQSIFTLCAIFLPFFSGQLTKQKVKGLEFILCFIVTPTTQRALHKGHIHTMTHTSMDDMGVKAFPRGTCDFGKRESNAQLSDCKMTTFPTVSHSRPIAYFPSYYAEL